MPVDLPPGWAITPTLEAVPDPNFPGPAAGPGFSRWTYICTDENSQYVCSSGAQEDCESQAQSMAQCRTQKQPYYNALP